MSAVVELIAQKQSAAGTAVPRAARPDLRMSYQEYLAWAGDEVYAEWVDGEVIVHMPPKEKHQALAGFLTALLRLYAQLLGLGRVWSAPLEVRLWPGGPSRQPDLLFVAEENLERVTPDRIEGAPDLVVEIVSDDSVQRDRVEKFDEYERAGVREYWILDNRPGRDQAWFFRLGAQDQYERVIVGPDGVYRSQVLEGFWLRLEWLWAETPDEWRALAELLGPERVAEAMRQRLAP